MKKKKGKVNEKLSLVIKYNKFKLKIRRVNKEVYRKMKRIFLKLRWEEVLRGFSY